ncbi:bola-like protein [Zopfia rhizophila CBS 207.26]|uniref:Bola-like protein n=1 Tax=Zopfia rhizophila CBS 207.26 TaxID=1314779 RepID=A0A6A6EAS9_9PEZI|nr:bola-like protein [Zopfia rhizophila CBS 207.26]
MAPSRALSSCAAFVQLRQPPCLLSTTCRIRIQPTSPLAIRPDPSQETFLSQSHHPSTSRRWYSQDSKPPEPPDYLSEGELHVFNKIKAELDPVRLEVQDISGGCGSMYALNIESARFKGLPVIKQHKMVNSVLAEEIKNWHGVQLKTRAA